MKLPHWAALIAFALAVVFLGLASVYPSQALIFANVGTVLLGLSGGAGGVALVTKSHVASVASEMLAGLPAEVAKPVLQALAGGLPKQ